MIKTTQKMVKVGSSDMVTVPAHVKRELNLKTGDTVKVTYELAEQPTAHDVEVVAIAQKLIARHKTALKNLSQR
jgi:antitoxin component of MazEF toxin-antitoxin module